MQRLCNGDRVSPRKARPAEQDPYAELRTAVGLDPRVDLGNDPKIRGQLELAEDDQEETGGPMTTVLEILTAELKIHRVSSSPRGPFTIRCRCGWEARGALLTTDERRDWHAEHVAEQQAQALAETDNAKGAP